MIIKEPSLPVVLVYRGTDDSIYIEQGGLLDFGECRQAVIELSDELATEIANELHKLVAEGAGE